MEAECIPYCLVDTDQTGTTLVACNSSERTTACPDDCAPWASRHTSQSAACDATFNAWAACITSVGCQDAETFFRHHPDGVVPGDPCAVEYDALECQDFEPLTEYSFSS